MKDKQKRSEELDLDLSLKIFGEVESTNKISTLDEAMNFELKHHEDLSPDDKKKLRRKISNKLSARRSRFKKVTHKNKLEQNAKDLQDEISLMGSKLKNVKHNNDKLQMENGMLQEQLDGITEKTNRNIAEMEELKLEVNRLKVKLAKAQGYQDYMEIEGESFDSYDYCESESAEEIDIDQYLNLDDDM